MWTRLITAAAVIFTAACGQEAAVEAPAEAATEMPAAAASEMPTFARQASPAGAGAYIIEPADGATVSSPVRIVFGLSGIGVVPAGIERTDAGHHHLLVDASLPNLDLPIPSDENYRHFGAGQTETEIELEPGSHTLQLLLGDHLHVPHDPPVMSDQITIEVR